MTGVKQLLYVPAAGSYRPTALASNHLGDEVVKGFWGGSMKVIVIRQPWAWLIVNGIKDIENRSWGTRYRGPLLIQASARRSSKREMEDLRVFARKRGAKLPDKFEFGGIVGIVRLDDCVDKSKSKWFEGPVGWVVSSPEKLPFAPLKGRLGLFDPPHRVLKKLGLRTKFRT